LHKLKNVHLLGWCNSYEIDNLLKKSDLFILPTYSEGFPNSILEALNNGLPIISTPVGGISDSVINNKNGFLIKPGNINMIKRSMEWFTYNRKSLLQFSNFSRTIALQNHDLNANCSKLFRIFKG